MYHSKETVTGPTAEICERIWLSIAEKRLRPGARLKEEQLAEIFGTSRTRVRQALSVLESDGLVTIIPNRGAFVAEPTIDEARDVFHVRRQIEARIIERLVERVADSDLPQIDAHLAKERAAFVRGDTSAMIRLAGGFHLLLAELCGSDFLYGILRDLISRTSLITAMYRERQPHYCGPDDHEAILRLVCAGDRDRALEIMRKHLDHIEAELNLTEKIPMVHDLRQALA